MFHAVSNQDSSDSMSFTIRVIGAVEYITIYLKLVLVCKMCLKKEDYIVCLGEIERFQACVAKRPWHSIELYVREPLIILTSAIPATESIDPDYA